MAQRVEIGAFPSMIRRVGLWPTVRHNRLALNDVLEWWATGPPYGRMPAKPQIKTIHLAPPRSRSAQYIAIEDAHRCALNHDARDRLSIPRARINRDTIAVIFDPIHRRVAMDNGRAVIS